MDYYDWGMYNYVDLIDIVYSSYPNSKLIILRFVFGLPLFLLFVYRKISIGNWIVWHVKIVIYVPGGIGTKYVNTQCLKLNLYLKLLYCINGKFSK